MRDTILLLLKKYYKISMLIPRTIINEKQGKMTMQVFDDVAPNVWQMYLSGTVNQVTGYGTLDIKQAMDLQEGERTRIARQLFSIALMVLNERSHKTGSDVKKEWHEFFKDVEPKESDGHEKLITYSLGAFFHVGIITPFDYDLSEPAFDETGSMLYMKNLPKPKEDILSDVMPHYED